MPTIPQELLEYVEQAEGLKFLLVPTLHFSKNVNGGRGANHASVTIDDNGKDLAVIKATITVHPKFKQPIVKRDNSAYAIGFDKLIIVHELRENIQFQNKQGLNAKTLHNQVMVKENQDMKWLEQKGYLTKFNIRIESNNYF